MLATRVWNMQTEQQIENAFRLQQYRGDIDLKTQTSSTPVWDNIFKIMAGRYKYHREFLEGLISSLWNLDDTIGVQLDRIGTFWGIARLGNEYDESYRARIRQAHTQNNSGTYPELYGIVQSLTLDPEPYLLQEHPWGNLIIYTPVGSDVDASIDSSVAAGIIPRIGVPLCFVDSDIEQALNPNADADLLCYVTPAKPGLDFEAMMTVRKAVLRSAFRVMLQFLIERYPELGASFIFTVNGISFEPGVSGWSGLAPDRFVWSMVHGDWHISTGGIEPVDERRSVEIDIGLVQLNFVMDASYTGDFNIEIEYIPNNQLAPFLQGANKQTRFLIAKEVASINYTLTTTEGTMQGTYTFTSAWQQFIELYVMPDGQLLSQDGRMLLAETGENLIRETGE